MGFSHERLAAARTILRTRELAVLMSDPSIADDAETAVSGYLSDEFDDGYVDEYIAQHYPEGAPLPTAMVIADLGMLLEAAASESGDQVGSSLPLEQVLSVITEYFTPTADTDIPEVTR